MSGMLEEHAGDLEAAERIYRESCAGLDGLGETGYLSTHAAQLARILGFQGCWDEAADFLAMADRATNPGDMASLILCGSARALILTHAGEHAQAELHAREAVRLAETTDAIESHGHALLDLATVLESAGKQAEAAAATEAALRLFEQKESAPMIARARERLGALTV